MKVVCPLLFSLALSPLAALAQTPTAPSLTVPGVVTTAGEKFATRCDDDAFRKTIDADKLARKCQHLFARWHSEAARYQARRANSRVDSVVQVAQRPSDETLVWSAIMPPRAWAKPLQASYSLNRLR